MSYNVVSFSGGKDSTCLLLMMLERGMQVDEVVFFDTGWEFPQMYEHIEMVEAYTGRKITVLQDSVGPLTERMLNNHRTRGARVSLAAGMGWPGPTTRWCTTQKVAAIKKHLASHENVVQFVGIAADEPQRVRGERYPLVEWGVTEADALSYCYERGFDWGGLYEHFKRVSCFCCPLQSIAELRELRHYHPELWRQMMDWDIQIAMQDAPQKRFRNDYSLPELEMRFRREDAQMRLDI